MFVPIHEVMDNYGYIIFGDNVDVVGNGNHLFEFITRFDVIMSKVRQNISLRVLNKKLIELTETDVLTNVKNRAAYSAKETELNSVIRSGMRLSFAIGIFDVNNLKTVNDTHGHKAGDEYIREACRIICKIFKHSPVYRIGGDEFVVIMRGEDYDNRRALFGQLRDQMDINSEDNKVVFASGISEYDPSKDSKLVNVFERADRDMYQNKKMLKSL